ncbi:MAG: hypothetical protein HZB55_02575 [Deltaproteobacteria bacterium]|nr:hypothetical protein [Deltaproteobacteria bacterium]
MTDAEKKPAVRVSLAKKHLATETGAALLTLLREVVEDGRLSDDEIRDLAAWLDRVESDCAIPGVHFLREELASILADRVISDSERALLQAAVLRVLPPAEREPVKAKYVAILAQERQRRIPTESLATERQREFIRDLGGKCPDDATKETASRLIDGLLAQRPTVRQRMVLRFWDKLDLMSKGVEAVSSWMDRWYAEDPARLAAWELWKSESGDGGGRSPDSVDRVPIGIGRQYLARVKAERPVPSFARGQRPPQKTGRGGCLGQIIFGGLLLALLFSAWTMKSSVNKIFDSPANKRVRLQAASWLQVTPGVTQP